MIRLFLLAWLAVGSAAADELNYVRVPSGEYRRGFDGSNDGDGRFQLAHPYSTSQFFRPEQPAHSVQISRAFELAATETTVAQFRDFVNATGYVCGAEKKSGALGFFPQEGDAVKRFHTDPAVTWRNPGFKQTADCPVVCVSLRDAEAFCEWLTDTTGKNHRLPTEAEWEYACRAGSESWYSWGNDPDQAYIHGNFADGALESAHPKTTSYQRAVKLGRLDGDSVVHSSPVAQFESNPWGLYDMHGNVWEWCSDLYEQDHYERLLDGVSRQDQKSFVVTDPKGPETTEQHVYGDWRVIRGGSWFTAPAYARSSIRGYAEASEAACYTGFRVLRELGP